MTAAARASRKAWTIQQHAMAIQKHPVLTQEEAGALADVLWVWAAEWAAFARDGHGVYRAEAALDKGLELLGLADD